MDIFIMFPIGTFLTMSYHLFNHIKTTTTAVELWEDVIVLEQSGKHVLLVQSKCPHILHPTLEEKLVLSFAEVLPLDHPGWPEFEEHAALHGDVHVEGKMGGHHRGELLHSGKYLYWGNSQNLPNFGETKNKTSAPVASSL